MQPVEVIPGDGPIVLGQPHGGIFLPEQIARKLNQNGRELADTDWHIGRLFDGLLPGATIIRANFHRYVIDANRDPSGHSLYPGQNTTTLVPLTDFDGHEIWSDPPDDDAIDARRQRYHAPYHAALREALERTKARHGFAILFDCHSIRSHIPFLFDGELPVFNTGTNDGATCDARIAQTVHAVALGSGMPAVLNGRFKGGWTTRHYGQPASAIHAIQMEIAQRAYLEEAPPWRWQSTQADRTRAVLRRMLEDLSNLALSGALHN